MSRVIRVIDLETSGLAPPAEVIEIGFCDLVFPGDGEDMTRHIGEMGSKLFGVTGEIPPETSAIHHLTVRDVEGQPLFVDQDLDEIFAGANGGVGADVYAAHNSQFDSQWFSGKPILCTMKAAARVWPDAPSVSNGTLRYWLGLDLDPALSFPPHRAGPDAYVTANILDRLLDHATVREMLAWTGEPRVIHKCPIDGRLKEKGRAWPDVSHGLLTWIAGQDGLGEDIRWNAQRELERRRA